MYCALNASASAVVDTGSRSGWLVAPRPGLTVEKEKRDIAVGVPRKASTNWSIVDFNSAIPVAPSDPDVSATIATSSPHCSSGSAGLIRDWFQTPVDRVTFEPCPPSTFVSSRTRMNPMSGLTRAVASVIAVVDRYVVPARSCASVRKRYSMSNSGVAPKPPTRVSRFEYQPEGAVPICCTQKRVSAGTPVEEIAPSRIGMMKLQSPSASDTHVAHDHDSSCCAPIAP